jgi:uncharacterized membrane protein (UPF0127 family)
MSRRPLTLPDVVNAERNYIVNLTRGSVVCERGLIADHPIQRMRGLMGRRLLPAGEGLLLSPAPSIHTGFMRFPIDVIFLDRERRVLKLVEQLRPWRMAGARGARSVLELAPSEVARRGVEVGDLLDVVPAMHLLSSACVDPDHTLRAVVDDGSNGRDAAASPARLLLIAADRRFRAVASALLTRRGCSVTLGEWTASVAELATRAGAEVVILEAGVSPAAAARQAAHLQTLDPPVGVVIVGEEPLDGPSSMGLLSKWGSFDGLYEEIQRVRPDRSGRPS